MSRSKKKTRVALLVALALMITLAGATWALEPPSGYLLVPGDHAGVCGENDITVTATGLMADVSYRIKMDVSYHANPRNPPDVEGFCESLGTYADEHDFLSDGTDVDYTFTVPLQDCHCQITAGFTLLYWNGQHFVWNGDERATETVDIWCDFCPPDGEGCTPGYWKNHLDAWAATGYSPGDDFDSTFGVDLFDPDITLEQAVNAKGGGVKKLARHGTAALLSAAHPDVDYPLTVADVIAAVQAGDADTLVAANELGCPLD